MSGQLLLSKVLAPSCRVRTLGVFPPPARAPEQRRTPALVPRRHGHYIPKTQYDMPFPMKLKPLKAVRVYWELAPILIIVSAVMGIMVFHIFWATQNKVDVVFTANSRNNISRTMNLRKPTVHKLVTINQRYEPWPEMQDVLDKMTVIEHKLILTTNRQC